MCADGIDASRPGDAECGRESTKAWICCSAMSRETALPSAPTQRVPDTLHVHYQDDTLLVVEKPAGLLAVPGRGAAGIDNLAARLQARYADALIVHRLDMATSGLMVFARGAEAQRRLSMAFAERRVVKTYVASVQGEITGEQGEIDAPLAADWPQRPRQRVDLAKGKAALTRWRVLARLAGSTRLRLEPVTGRSHQLRVHLLSIGHPIRGDALYAPSYASSPDDADRLLLHATVLEFAHPLSGSALHFTSEAEF